MARNHQRIETVFFASTLLCFANGCAPLPDDESEAVPTGYTLTEDSRFMERLLHRTVHDRTTMKIDFSDAQQYRFVKNRLLAAGKSSRTAPRLFSRLQDLRAQAQIWGQFDTTGGVGYESSALTASTDPCAHLLELQQNSAGNLQNYQGDVLSSCKGGSQYTYQDMFWTQTNDAQGETVPLAATFGEEYGKGRYFKSNPLASSVAAAAGRRLAVDSLLLADGIGGVVGASQFTYTTGATSVENTSLSPATTTLVHPTERVTPNPSAPIVRVCLQRGVLDGNTDCDYAAVARNSDGIIVLPPPQGATGVAAADPIQTPATHRFIPDAQGYFPALPSYQYIWRGTFYASPVYIPVRGSVDFHLNSGCKVTGLDAPSSSIQLVKVTTGGYCQGGLQGGIIGTQGLPQNPPQLNIAGSVVSFDFLADFSHECFSGFNDDSTLVLELVANYSCAGDANNQTARITYNSKSAQGIAIDFANSCFAEGTKIRLADGRSVPIETVHVGDRLVPRLGSAPLTVATVSRGGEDKPMVQLRDQFGHEILVTSQHPVVLATGQIVAAASLKLGDRVQTEDGPATLESVERIPYQGRVFNVSLGTDNERAQISLRQHTLYANGFLMGDNDLQSALSPGPTIAPAASHPSDVSPEWRSDFSQSPMMGAMTW